MDLALQQSINAPLLTFFHQFQLFLLPHWSLGWIEMCWPLILLLLLQTTLYVWEIVEAMEHVVLNCAREIMMATHFFSFPVDEVTSANSQSWMFVLGYIVVDWRHTLMLLILERVVMNTQLIALRL